MIFQKNDQQWLGRFRELMPEPGLIHGFSTRKGGVSAPPFNSLNLGTNTSDTSDNVTVNRQQFFHKLEIPISRLAVPQQIHEDRVALVGEPGGFPETDAVITKMTGVALSIQVADCVPIFLYDPSVPCIGLAHAGWRSTVKRIAQKTVEAMVSHYQANPKAMRACIGPSIGPCCFEVGKDVQTQFDTKYIIHESLDLWTFNLDQLKQAGIPEQSIQISSICTRCNASFFFSHRASGGQTGRMMAVMMLSG